MDSKSDLSIELHPIHSTGHHYLNHNYKIDHLLGIVDAVQIEPI